MLNETAILPCEYNYVGCRFDGKKSEHRDHNKLDAEKHLKLAMDWIEMLKGRIIENDREEGEIWKRRNSNPCNVSVHKHALIFNTRDNGWGCDGRRQPGGCKSKISGFSQTHGMWRYRCDNCDYDLCYKCLEAYITDN